MKEKSNKKFLIYNILPSRQVFLSILFLGILLPLSRFVVSGEQLPALYWIYEQSVQQYIQQDVYYLELTDPTSADRIFGDLQAQGIIESYEQPFGSSDLPYYRVAFGTHNEVTKRMISLLMKEGSIKSVEGVPLFRIQQAFSHTPVQNDQQSRKILTGKPVRFTTQQVQQGITNRQRYLDTIGYTSSQLKCFDLRAPKVKVAIIDNAFMTNHPNIRGSIKEVIDVTDNDVNVLPPMQSVDWMHGTHSAALIAGKKYESQGIIGLSLAGADLYLIKATADTASPNDITHGIEAFAKAVDMDVDVISLSWGAYMDFPIFRTVIQKAIDKGIIVIAAAGNYGSDDLFYPAAYDPVIAVGSVDQDMKRSKFSNYGTRVDIYAPGEKLIVPDGRNDYAMTDGTSAAAPLFAGVYSLLMRTLGTDRDLQDFFAQHDILQDIDYLSVHDICDAGSGLLEVVTGSDDTSGSAIQEPVQEPDPDPVFVPQQHEVAPQQQQPIPVQEIPSPQEKIFAFMRFRGGWIAAIAVGCLAIAFSGSRKATIAQPPKEPSLS